LAYPQNQMQVNWADGNLSWELIPLLLRFRTSNTGKWTFQQSAYTQVNLSTVSLYTSEPFNSQPIHKW